MDIALVCDEELVQRLPLPLAQLYRRAHNAPTPLERQLTAYYLWEAALKLLACGAVVEYAGRPGHPPEVDARLANLASPSLGQWWELVRCIVPVLAGQGDRGFTAVRDLLLDTAPHDDMPRCAGLDACLRETFEGGSRAAVAVRLVNLFDRLVQYRNREIGHGAAGQGSREAYERLGRAMLAAQGELLRRLDVLAGRRLVYLGEVHRDVAGGWSAQRFHLVGETARLAEPLELPDSEDARRLLPRQVYLVGVAGSVPDTPRALHPLVTYDPDKAEVAFFNCRRGRQRVEYLCYTRGQVASQCQWVGPRQEFLARILDLPAGNEPPEPGPAPDEQPPAAATGGTAATRPRYIGEYELLSTLGTGGMGVVYRAHQGGVGREVALKCLLHPGDTEYESRFGREIRALGRTQHPNLVKVFASGSQDAWWFYAMELVEGATLAAVCEDLQSRTPNPAAVDLQTWHAALSTKCEAARSGGQPPGGSAHAQVPAEPPATPAIAAAGHVAQVVELIRQAAEAAHALHEAGVVHRDIKPGNIMVSPDGSRAVLMDLGLAQLADEVDRKLTRTRRVVGTLRYASPEQVLAAGPVDRRSDVYSLGATLWELLTLRPLYGATDRTPDLDLMQWIQFKDPERVRKYHPGVPPALEAVVMKCLAKDPARRYATAHDLAEDLARWQRGEPVLARPLSWRDGLVKLLRRHGRRAAAWSGLVALGMGLAVALVYFTPRPPPPSSRPPSPPPTSGAPAPPPRVAQRRALLVGCTRYVNLDGQFQLQGPGNDVVLMRKLLHEKFQLAQGEIVTLADELPQEERKQFWVKTQVGGVFAFAPSGNPLCVLGPLALPPQDPARLATRANIQREIVRMARMAMSPEDQFIIFLAGHSTQAPVAGGGPRHPMETLFLPRDVGKWDSATTRVRNAITSRDFTDWTKPIAEAGARLWLIYDGCHGDLGYQEVYGKNAVFTYACRPNEPTVELLIPPEGRNRKAHGLFTYTLNQVLKPAPKPIRYTEMVKRIRDRYVADGRVYPAPWVAGGNVNGLILDGKGWRLPDPIQAMGPRHEGDEIKINAGALDGLTEGMVFAIRRPDGQTAEAAATPHVRVTRVHNDDAIAQPIAFGGAAEPEPPQCSGFSEPVHFDFGEQRLTVCVPYEPHEHRLNAKPIPQARYSQLVETLQRLVAETGLPVRLLRGSTERARWAVYWASDEADAVYLCAHSESRPTARGLVRERYDDPVVLGPVPLNRLAADLGPALGRIARGQNLMALTDRLAGERIRWGVGMDAEMQMVRYRDEADKNGTEVEDFGEVTLRAGSFYALCVYNRTDVPLDVTILQLDDDYTLHPFFPRPGARANNRVAPQDRLTTPLEQAPAEDDAGPLWRRRRKTDYHFLLIAVAAHGPPVDFTCLTQSTHERASRATETAHLDLDRTLRSPLGQLIANALYAEGTIRGLDVSDMEHQALRKVSWRRVPAAEGASWLTKHLRHARQGQWDDADYEYARAVASAHLIGVRPDELRWPPADPDWPRWEREHWEEVLEGLTGAAREGKPGWWVWRARGLVQAALGRWKDAAEDLRKAAEGKADDAETWRLLAWCLAMDKAWDAAAEACYRSIELKRADGSLWYLHGLVCASSGQHDKAARDYSRAAENGFNGWVVWYRKGTSHDKLRQWREAVDAYSKAMASNPRSPEVLKGRGDAYAELGRWDDAIGDFTTLVKEQPDEASAWTWQALAQLGKGDTDGYRQVCKGMLERFASSKEENVVALVALTATLLPESGVKPESLVRLARQSVAANPKSSVFNQTLGAALYRAGDFKGAVAALNKASEVEGKGGEADTQLFLALANHRQGNTRQAGQWMARALKHIEGAKSPDWWDVIIWSRLRAEAEALLKTATP
jgi:serine/threonine protein kinase/tetratricopeptide (TPR) repeat protein